MTPHIVSDLVARMRTAPRSLAELHAVAQSAGSTWSIDQVRLLLACLPGMSHEDDRWRCDDATTVDPLVEALMALATSTPRPAAALVSQLPSGRVASAAALCEIARNHPQLELLAGNRIRRRP